MSISIELKNLSAVQAFATRLPDKMQAVFSATADAILFFESVAAAKEQVLDDSRKPRSRSGGYLRSIHSKTVKTRFQVIGQVVSDHEQAAVLEFGSPPHVIEAKDKNTLFWPGAFFPVKKVNHPGTPAFKVLGQSVERGLAQVDRIVQQKLADEFV
jgi:hypothetical protein